MRKPVAFCANDLTLQISKRPGIIKFNLKVQNIFISAAADSKHAVGRDFGYRLLIVGIHLELAFGVHGAFYGAAHDSAFREHQAAEIAAKVGIFANLFSKDVTRALESFLEIQNLARRVDESCRKSFEGLPRVDLIPKIIGQGLQAALPGNHRLGAAFGFVRKIEIFEYRPVESGFDTGLEFVRKLALLCDGPQNGCAPVFQFAKVGEFLLYAADRHFIQVACHFFAITRDERNRAAFVQKLDGRQEAWHSDADFFCNVGKYCAAQRDLL